MCDQQVFKQSFIWKVMKQFWKLFPFDSGSIEKKPLSTVYVFFDQGRENWNKVTHLEVAIPKDLKIIIL